MLSMFVAAYQWRTSVAVVKSPSFTTAADDFVCGLGRSREVQGSFVARLAGLASTLLSTRLCGWSFAGRFVRWTVRERISGFFMLLQFVNLRPLPGWHARSCIGQRKLELVPTFASKEKPLPASSLGCHSGNLERVRKRPD